jgi:hypothetical protein
MKGRAEMKATYRDVLDGSAHMVNGTRVFRVHNPADSGDPDAKSEIVVSVYPDPNMPDSHEMFRIATPCSPRKLAKEMRDRGYYVTPHMDD